MKLTIFACFLVILSGIIIDATHLEGIACSLLFVAFVVLIVALIKHLDKPL